MLKNICRDTAPKKAAIYKRITVFMKGQDINDEPPA